jgi:hypothetical protein
MMQKDVKNFESYVHIVGSMEGSKVHGLQNSPTTKFFLPPMPENDLVSAKFISSCKV